MKTTTFACLAGLALISAARAGTPAPPILTCSAPGGALWQWFAGGSAGYLTDTGEGMYSIQAGVEYKKPCTRRSQALFLQVGYAQDKDKYDYHSGIPGARSGNELFDWNVIPITLNYKFQAPLAGHLNYYVGLGAGIAIMNSTDGWNWRQSVAPPGGIGIGRATETDVRLYGEVFAGLSYDISESFEVFGGVRYIIMDNARRASNLTAGHYHLGLNGDLLLELGTRVHF